jgi:hypothetical protein
MKEVEKMKLETRIAGTPPEPKKSDDTKKNYRKENRKVLITSHLIHLKILTELKFNKKITKKIFD